VLKPPHAPSDDLDLDLKVRVSRRLSPIETPQEVRFVEAVPVDQSGRTDCDALRAKYPELFPPGIVPWEDRL